LLFGLLSGKFDRNSTFADNDHRQLNLAPDKLNAYLDELTDYQPVFEQYSDYSKAQLSLRFCIAHPACHVVIPGGKSLGQVQENAVASDIDFIPFEVFDK